MYCKDNATELPLSVSVARNTALVHSDISLLFLNKYGNAASAKQFKSYKVRKFKLDSKPKHPQNKSSECSLHHADACSTTKVSKQLRVT